MQSLKEGFHKNKNKKDGFAFWCKTCIKEYGKKFQKKWYKKHKEKRKESYQENKKEILELSKMYREENKEKISKRKKQWYQKNKEQVNEHVWLYRQKNRKSISEQKNKYQKQRRQEDPNYKITCNLRRRLCDALKGRRKLGSAINDLGCSIEDLKIQLETAFHSHPKTGEMMAWKNYGKNGWEIDHIKPLVGFDLTDRKQFLEACHFTNLRPMWASQNRSEGARGYKRENGKTETSVGIRTVPNPR